MKSELRESARRRCERKLKQPGQRILGLKVCLTLSFSPLNGANSAKSLIHWCSLSMHYISLLLTLFLLSTLVRRTVLSELDSAPHRTP